MSAHPVYTAAQTVGKVFLNKSTDRAVISLCLGNKWVFFCHNAKQTFAQGLRFLSLKLPAQQALTFSLLFRFPHFSPVIDSMKKCLS